MSKVAASTDREITRLLPDREDRAQPLAKAMWYPISSGGKRFRPFLVHTVGHALGADANACLRVGAAVEILHSYSLVHDDLPAMDDAQMRRGRPACHRAFDEATAVLVGDALLALAFEAICRDDWPATSEQRLLLARKLAYAAGGEQLCAGQMLDLRAPDLEPSLDDVRRLQALKTGALIRYSCEAACILAESDRTLPILAYADALGLAFQISDDLLDVIGDSAEAGKDLGRDAAQSKATFVTHLGIDGAQMELTKLCDRAFDVTACLGSEAEGLRDLFDFVINRRV